MKRKALYLALLLVLGLAVPLIAQPFAAGSKIPAFATSGAGVVSAVAAGTDGGFAVLWLRKDGNLIARAFTAAGSPAGPEHTLSVPQTVPGPSTFTIRAGFWSLAAHPGGGYVAVWAEVTNNDYTFSSIFKFQRLDASGEPVGPAQKLKGEDYSSVPFQIQVDASGGLTIAWSDGFLSVAQRFDANGVAQNPSFVLANDPVLANDYPTAILPDGGFVVARDPLEGPLTVRLFHPDGSPASADIPVDAQTVARTHVRVAAGPEGHFVVAWKEAGERILARLFGPDGRPLTSKIVVVPSHAGVVPVYSLNAAVNAAGSFLIQWTLGGDLVATAFDASGDQIGPGLQLDHSVVGGFEADAAAIPGGWISSWTTNLGNNNSSGPWLSLALACALPGEPGLCLNGNRFRATVTWRVSPSAEGSGIPIPLTGDTGAFWFFSPENYELVVKVLDGNAINGHFWVFYGSLTDVEFDLTVTDTLTGEQRTYHNTAGTMASHADTEAF